MDDSQVADNRDLPSKDSSFDAVFDKGTLHSIYFSGGSEKELSRKILAWLSLNTYLETSEACTSSIQKSFDESKNDKVWEQVSSFIWIWYVNFDNLCH